ncbi:hypothetical protein BJY24_001336 [Nocardia transvalensis]|uniref:Uncharacterized protein n=1 Tax=Nocardia transvalensis TaxID=37333 RepID=A0A7W9UGN0_9NOCA|nr:hypothetical protein [Nocardia transvalensis]MBB5912469.1 hypothetical protein [Nocardia transvalensis]
MVEDLGHLVEHFLPSGWLFPAALVFGAVVVVALVVLLLVSGSDFDEHRAPATTTHGTCAPFCYGTSAVPTQPR